MAPSPTSRKAREIFEDAIECDPPDARAAFVAQACGGDPVLLRRVEDLLRANAAAESLLPNEPQPPAFSSVLCEQPGDRIGHYKLLEKIGEGGCGVVYMAEQEEPVRRRVALKLVKPGMDTRSVIARFEAERQALAMMDHPGIAQIHDGGVVGAEAGEFEISNLKSEIAGGRPFFVMELVRGIRITDYCRDHALTTRQRLDLFTAVCSAVQHAHQKGIIHRDLKPSNILVTEIDGRPVPKVIDFGIAKATGQKLTDKTLFTQFAQFVGTPAYMSPEQAAMSGADIDTRSDIYSLGVLLYELLTGAPPFDAQELLKAGFDEMRRTIRETEPPKPSTRLTQYQQSGVAAAAGAHPPKRGTSNIASDLDWIVMKALEKDRARRYETASGMAKDIERHLNNEPVTARPASAGYRFRKMVRRNKLAFAAAAAVLSAVFIGLGVSTWMFVQERDAREKERQALVRAVAAEKEQSEERQKAEIEASKSRQVAKFLTDMLDGVGPSVALGDDTKLLRKILDKTIARLGEDLMDQPSVEADLRNTMGNVYMALGDHVKAGEMHAEVLEIRKKLFGNDHPDVAAALNNLALDLNNQGKLVEAEKLFREALAIPRNPLGDKPTDAATTLHNLACLLFDQGKLAEAESLHREALEIERTLRGGETASMATSLNSLATVLQRRGKLAEAEAMHREALAMRRKLLGDEHPDVASSLNNLSIVLLEQGKYAEAETTQREALTMKRKLLGPEHPEVATAMLNLAQSLARLRKLDEAESMHREALAMKRKLLGNDHPDVWASLNGLAVTLQAQGKGAEAESLVREAEAGMRKLLGDEHPDLARLLDNLGFIMGGQQKYAEAESLHRQALTMSRKLLGNGHPHVATALKNLARALDNQGKLAEANTLFRDDLAMSRASANEDPAGFQSRLVSFADRLSSQSEFAEAEPLLLEGIEIAQKVTQPGAGHSKRDLLTRLLRLYQAWDKPEKAAECQQKLAEFDKAPAEKATGTDAISPKPQPGQKTP